MRWIAMSLCAALSLAAVPESAQACGGIGSSYTLLTDDQNGVPAGTKLLRLYVYGVPSEQVPSRAILSVDHVGGGLPVTLPVTLRTSGDWLIEIDLGTGSVEAGAEYTLSLSSAGAVGPDPLRFHGVQAAPLPTELGQLTLRARESGRITFGGCGESRQGEHAVLALEPSAAALPWVRAVSHQLYMDGAPLFEPELPLVNYVAQPQAPVVRAIATCERPANGAGEGLFKAGIEVVVPAGKHSMQWKSTLPNGTVLQTDALEVDLRCDGSTDATRDAGAQAAADAGAALSSDAGVPSRADAGPTQTGGQDAGRNAGDQNEEGPSDAIDPDAGGCSLGHGQRASAPVAFAALVLLGLLSRMLTRRAVVARANGRTARRTRR